MHPKRPSSSLSPRSYQSLLTDVARIYEDFQSTAISDWNKSSLVGNWKIGQRIVEVEQGNQERARYGDRILIQLSKDLNKRFGKGFSDRNLRYMRRFFQFYKLGKIRSELSWTHYRALLLVEDDKIRNGLEKEAIVKGWSHRELLLKAQAVLRKRDSAATAETDSEFSEDGDKAVLQLKRPFLGLFTYRVIQNFSSNLERSVPNLDLGFDVRIESALGGSSKLPIGSIVSVDRNRKGYSFQKVSGNKLL
ncbi:PF06250 domain protein [Leptospira borgpetersenii serovar Pomona str. 200901868]|uniref:PF06250 domain protein n=1 Tax=Leptospira borgpetersenii serovar Pomona str. 200901868 TaxID=1192866 RepID=M6VZZ3_LEPBO|nr:PF06250 domain protein [Leptospira sp. serovar Kenya str. Sh9]EMO62410.1 PF06250 domain protein [Leptospira borgpetersenii serovar Pomona str. 200901868]